MNIIAVSTYTKINSKKQHFLTAFFPPSLSGRFFFTQHVAMKPLSLSGALNLPIYGRVSFYNSLNQKKKPAASEKKKMKSKCAALMAGAAYLWNGAASHPMRWTDARSTSRKYGATVTTYAIVFLSAFSRDCISLFF
jgi:hypothetical protein